jgi:hypothetical protein
MRAHAVRSSVLVLSLASAACLAPIEPRLDSVTPDAPAVAGPPRSFAAPVQMTGVFQQRQWPEIAGCADGRVAAISPDGTLSIFDSHGDLQHTSVAPGKTVACSGDVFALTTESGLDLVDARGVPVTAVDLGGTKLAVAPHPAGGFVASYESESGTQIVRVGVDGAVAMFADIIGWKGQDPRPPLLAVREDGLVATIIHGAGSEHPSMMLDTWLEQDFYTEVGVRSLVVLIRPDGTLADAVSFWNWGRLVELRADSVVQAMTEDLPAFSTVRSLVRGDVITRVRRYAEHAAGVVYFGDVPAALVMEGDQPSLSLGTKQIVLRPEAPGVATMVLKGWGFEQYVVPFLEQGDCRSFSTAGQRVFAACSGRPVATLMARPDIEDTDEIGWIVSVTKADLGL